MERDIELARAALSNAPGLSDEAISSQITNLGEGGVDLLNSNESPVAKNPPDPETNSSQPPKSASEEGVIPLEKAAFGDSTMPDPRPPSAAENLNPVVARASEHERDVSEPRPVSDVGQLAGKGENHPNHLQLIDEHQKFHMSKFQAQLAEWGMADVGFGYDLLFGTRFDVMNERARQQTTKGIWLSRGMDRNVLVMDVEGTDGRERGEDQDFERKSSLFALTTAECLIVNMWENQVGLYQGANMGLLKTVLDVNLSLFQSSRARAGAAHEKTQLLFVIRDFVGMTPLENLEATVLGDLDRMWKSLNKPANLTDAKLTDFFDVKFSALPHKILLPREFDASVDALRTRFVDREDPDYVFQTQYHKRIPIDGLPHYLESVWEQVMQNKDLDLPTQQELLAQFRCDEIAEVAVRPFHAAIQAFRKVLDAGDVHPSLGTDMATHRGTALAAFDKDASRYHQGVYARKRADLVEKLNTALLPSMLAQLKNLHVHLSQHFRAAVLEVIRHSAQYNFGNVVREQHDAALAHFDELTSAMLLPDTNWSVDEDRTRLEAELNKIAQTLRADESKKMTAQIQRDVGKRLTEPVELAMSHPSEKVWDTVLLAHNDVMADAMATYLQRAGSLNSTAEEIAAGQHALQRAGWQQLITKVHQQTADAVLSVRLRAYFEERFRYDQDGVPRVWKPTDDMDGAFVRARDATLQLIPLYARIAPTDPTLLQKVKASEQDSVYVELVASGDEEPLDVDGSLHVLSDLQSAEIGSRFRKDADAFYVEAKRSTVSSMSQVPPWMYVVLLLLGWNEMMAVLRSPVYFTLLCMFVAGAYAVWRLNLSGPLLAITTTLVREVQQMVEDKLRAYLVPPAAAQVPPLRHQPTEGHERRAAPVAQ